MKKIILICFVLTLGFFLISCDDDDETGPKPQDTPTLFTPTPIPTATEIPAAPTPTPTTPSYQGEWSGWIETNTNKHHNEPECFDGTIWFRVIDDTIVKGDVTICLLAQSGQAGTEIVTEVIEFEVPIIDGKFEYKYYEDFFHGYQVTDVTISGSFDSYRTITGAWGYYYNFAGEYRKWGGGQWHAEKRGD